MGRPVRICEQHSRWPGEKIDAIKEFLLFKPLFELYYPRIIRGFFLQKKNRAVVQLGGATPDLSCGCSAKLFAGAPSTNFTPCYGHGAANEKRNHTVVPSVGCGLSAEPELFTSSNVRVRASRVPLKLSTILSS